MRLTITSALNWSWNVDGSRISITRLIARDVPAGGSLEIRCAGQKCPIKAKRAVAPRAVCTVSSSRRESVSRHSALRPMRDLSPGKTRLHTPPGPVRAQSLQRQELPHRLDGRIGRRRADAAGALIREVPDLPGAALQPSKFAPQALVQVRWHCLPIPEP